MRAGIGMKPDVEDENLTALIEDVRRVSRALDRDTRMMAAEILTRWILWSRSHLPDEVMEGQEMLVSALVYPY